MNKSRPLLAVDGDSLAHRAFHALPSSIKGRDGRQSNMLVGFANMLTSVWESEQPRTMFVGFAAEQRPLAAMLESMAGLDDGTRDALTRYTRALTGAYYFVPSIESLLRLSGGS